MPKNRKTITEITPISVMLLTANFLLARISQKEQLYPPMRVPYNEKYTFLFGNVIDEGSTKKCQDSIILGCIRESQFKATIVGGDNGY